MSSNFKKVIITVIVVLIAVFVYMQVLDNEKDKTNPDVRVKLQDLKEKYKNKGTNNTNSSDNLNSNTNYSNNTSGNASNENSVSKPSSNTKVSLDTTGNYKGLRLERVSTANDFIAAEIKSSTSNKVSRLKGTEEPLILAVEKFNDYQESYSKYIAYKVIEYKEFDEDELDDLNDTYKSNGAKAAAEAYRITMKIYQYEPSSGSTYPESEYDPQYYRLIVGKVGGEYRIISAATAK